MLFVSKFLRISGIALFAAPICASSWPGRSQPTYTPAWSLSKLSKLLPTSTLPTPDGELKYVLLGVGTQNYTCTSSGPDATPGTTGATGKFF
jgi:hypothetical protein